MTQVHIEKLVFQRFLFFLIKPVPKMIVPGPEIFGLSFTGFSTGSVIWWNS